MKKLIPVIIFLLSHAMLFAQYEWRAKACPVLYQGGGISFAIGNKAYVVGGDTMPPSAVNITASVWEYNSATNNWARKNNFPYATNNPAWFVINDTAYVGLGLDNTSTYHTDFWRYDQAGDQWIQVMSFPGSARYGTMSFSLNGKGYVGCGHGGTVYNDFYVYDPHQNTWTSRAAFPGAARQAGFGAAAGGKGYMGMGTGGGSYFYDIYRYNDAANTWAQIDSFTNTGRYSLGAFTLNDTLYAFGGVSPASFKHDCWRYNVSNDSWTAQAGFGHLCPDSVFVQDAFVINGHAYTRPLHTVRPLHLLLEFGPYDPTFPQQVSVLGNDTTYTGPFSRVLTAPDTSAVWSTGVRGPQITVTSPGTYTVRWNIPCGIANDTVRLSLNVGIATISGSDVQVYPNPVSGNNIELHTSQQMVNSVYSLYDLSGKTVNTGHIGSANSKIDMPDGAGIYFLSIKTAEDVAVIKILKLE